MIEFYKMTSLLSAKAFQAQIVQPQKGIEVKLTRGDYSNLDFPIIFKQAHGVDMQDLIDTGWPNLFLISERMRNFLEINQFSGWKVYDIKLIGKDKNDITGYSGFSITGRTGKVNFDASRIIQKQRNANAPLTTFFEGLFFDLKDWDKSDFFLPSNYNITIIPENVALAIMKLKLKNVAFSKLITLQIDDFTAHIISSK
jgi:hypothetical protein